MRKGVGRILLECFFIFLALALAGGIVVLFSFNLEHTDDTLSGTVPHQTVNVTSPVYGQLLTQGMSVGDTVHTGEQLATLQILNTAIVLPPSPLYQVQGHHILSLKSPVDGIVHTVLFSALSTVAGAATVMTITPTDTAVTIQVLFPQGSDRANYTTFWVASQANGTRFLLRMERQVPSDILSNIPITTTIYQATCQHASECTGLIDYNAVVIYAQKRDTTPAYLKSLLTWISDHL